MFLQQKFCKNTQRLIVMLCAHIATQTTNPIPMLMNHVEDMMFPWVILVLAREKQIQVQGDPK